MVEYNKYTVQGQSVGELLLKLIMQKSVIYTRSTASSLRGNPTNLETYITPVNSNIDTFNQHVKVNVEGLKSRVESIDDIMTNILKAYDVSSYTEFF